MGDTHGMAVPTHRFTLSPAVEDALNALSEAGFHTLLRSEADTRWGEFVTENEGMFETERRRLTALGYMGDLNTKMFRSARYYRGPRQQAAGAGDGARAGADGAAAEPVVRREYIAPPEHLLALMDEHVRLHCFGAEPRPPAHGWAAFQTEYGQAVTLVTQGLTGSDRLTSEQADAKVKKAYKNRHFLQRQKIKLAAARAAALAELE